MGKLLYRSRKLLRDNVDAVGVREDDHDVLARHDQRLAFVRFGGVLTTIEASRRRIQKWSGKCTASQMSALFSSIESSFLNRPNRYKNMKQMMAMTARQLKYKWYAHLGTPGDTSPYLNYSDLRWRD